MRNWERFLLPGVLIACLGASSHTTVNDCFYLPPSFADRVVFYDGFERSEPEINRIGAKSAGSVHLISDGFAGSACKSNDPKAGEKSFSIHSPKLSIDKPITAMRWWRVDSPMPETACFQLLAFLGKGHVSCFIRGKGEWCALQEPTMFVQVDHFPNIANVNWRVKDHAYFQPGDWHHIAITVANASEICFYLDGEPLVTVHCKGRLFIADDVNALQASSDAGDYAEHPTSTDELIVVDRALGADEITNYVTASRGLKAMNYPPRTPNEKRLNASR